MTMKAIKITAWRLDCSKCGHCPIVLVTPDRDIAEECFIEAGWTEVDGMTLCPECSKEVD